jgi:hypothetical protein
MPRDLLQGRLPFWALDHVNFIIPSSPNDFSRVGVSIDVGFELGACCSAVTFLR